MPPQLHQGGMRALLHYFAIMHYTDLISSGYGAEAVGYDQGGTPFHQPLQRFLHGTFALGVESRCRLVQNQYRGILKNGTGYADTLTLPSRQAASSVADICVIAMLGGHDEIMCVGYTRGLFHLFVIGLAYSERDVCADGIVEKYSLLVHISHERTQIVHLEPAYIGPSDGHRPLAGIIKARQQVHQRALAGTALPHNGHSLARHHIQTDILQHRGFASIAEIYTSEAYNGLSGSCRGQYRKLFRIGSILYRIV